MQNDNSNGQNVSENNNTEIHNNLQKKSNGENHLVDKHENLNGVGLLTLINEVKSSLDTNYHKKIEELEYKLLEKDEKIEELELEISTVKAQNEEKDLELFKLHEEISASKRVLTQFLEKIENH